MSTLWLERLPGQVAASNSEQVRRDPLEDPILVVGVDRPDWIGVPDETPHRDAGRRLRVSQRLEKTCHFCGAAALQFVLQESDLRVEECASCRVFRWSVFTGPPSGGPENQKTEE